MVPFGNYFIFYSYFLKLSMKILFHFPILLLSYIFFINPLKIHAKIWKLKKKSFVLKFDKEFNHRT